MTRSATLLNALAEPAMLVDPSRNVVFANRALRRLVGRDPSGGALATLLAADAPRTELYLDRCFGSGDPVIGALAMPVDGAPRKYHCKGNVIPADPGNLVLLRLSDHGERRFAALTQTIADLQAELATRMRSEARLAETARERELLLRELEHRVKNNMQMLSALLIGAEREASTPEAKNALSGASRRFAAVSAVQKLLYRSDDLGTIPARELIYTLTTAASSLTETQLETRLEVEDVDFSIHSSVSIGLVLNELITNAVKYGRPQSGSQVLLVGLMVIEQKLQFVVQDNGPGHNLIETSKRASGLGLVRGLLRQMGGALAIESAQGTRCIVSLPLASATAKAAA